MKNEQGYDFAYSGNQSLRGAIARVINDRSRYTGDEGASRKPADLPTVLLSILMLALAVIAAICARSELAAAAPFFCCLVLLSPLSWKAHYVILILPAAYLLSLTKAPGKARLLIAATLGAVFVLFNLTSARVAGLPTAEWADAHSVVAAGALVVFVACVAGVLMRKFGKQPHVC